MANPTRIALVGANYGATIASGFLGLDDVAVVGIADTDSVALDNASSALAISATFSSADELVSSTKPDALIVASPTYLHEKHSQLAFDNGMHVLCAAPVGVRESDVSHISTAAGLVGKTFMYANALRFDDRIQNARECVDSGKIGIPTFASGCIQIADWPHPGNSWRLERDLGGGALLEVGASALDALWYAFGEPDPIEAMAARFDAFSSDHGSDCEHPAEDTLTGFVRFKNGASLNFTAQLNAPIPPGETRSNLSIIGTEGTIDLFAGKLTLRSGPTASYASPSDDAACYRALATHFLRAIRDAQEPSANGKRALALQKTMDGLLKSAREKSAVSIKVERSLDDLFGGL